jgi:hypothetical protein
MQQDNGSHHNLVQQHLAAAGRYYEYTIRLERARQQEEQRRMVDAAVMAAQPPLTSSVVTVLPPLFISPFALLVILNNLGHLHATLSNEGRSKKCYRQLQSTLMFLLLHKVKNQSSSNVESENKNQNSYSKDLEVFMENATLGLDTTTSCRPTAAAA